MDNYKTKINTDRYVYHVASKRSRISIAENGLIPSSHKGERLNYKNAIFAHNSDIITLDWYPFNMDFYGWDYWDNFDYISTFPSDSKALQEVIKSKYDIWRIDTLKFNGLWYLDDIGERDFDGTIFKSKELYIVTFEKIKPTQISLCKIELKEISRTLKNINLRVTIAIPRSIAA